MTVIDPNVGYRLELEATGDLFTLLTVSATMYVHFEDLCIGGIEEAGS